MVDRQRRHRSNVGDTPAIFHHRPLPKSAGYAQPFSPLSCGHEADSILISSPAEVLDSMLARVAGGDRAAFEEIYRRTSAKLFGVCLRILPDRQQAEEALQEAYLSVWQRAAGFDAGRGTAMTWLISLARNRSIDRLRAVRRHVASPIDMASEVRDDRPDGLAMAEMADDERRLAGCMGGLDARDALFLRTAFFEGASYPELAERSGLPLGTLKSRVRRALLKLRACLG